MFFPMLTAMLMQSFVFVTILVGAVFVGLNNFARREIGVLHQLLVCEQHAFELNGQMENLKGSFAFRIMSGLLPESPLFVDETIVASSPVGVLRRILSLCPRLGRVLQSTQDLQRCELAARNLEKKLENIQSHLGVLRFLQSLTKEQFGNVCLYSGLCLALGGLLLTWNVLSTKTEDIDSENELQEDDAFELDWSSMESSLDVQEEIDERLRNRTENTSDPQQEQDKSQDMEAEIGRLCSQIDAIQNDREAEAEIATKTIHGLEEENHHYKSEIARLSKMIQAVQREKQAVTERAAKTVNNLQQCNKQLEAEADLVYSDYQALQEQRQHEKERANETINDLQIINDQLRKEIADKEASAEQHLDKTNEMEQEIRRLKGQLERAEEQNRAQIESQSQKESGPSTKKLQRKLITFDLEPSQPKIQSSSLPESHPAKNVKKEEEKMIVTVKERQKDRKIGQDEEVDKKEAQKPQIPRKAERKLITFDLEPDQPQMDTGVFSRFSTLPPRDQQFDSIIFRGEKVPVKRIHEMEGEWAVELDVPRNFHRAVNGIQGRTLEEITTRSGVALIKMPGRFQLSNLITIVGTIQQVRLAAGQIECIISKLQ